MQGLGASIQRAEWGMLTQCAEAGDIDPARAAQAGVLTQRAQALTQHAQALTQRARSEAPMQRAGARGVDAGRGADAGPGEGGEQLEHRLALGAREGDGKWNPPTRV